MRYKDLIRESNFTDRLRNEIVSLLVAANATGYDSIDTENLLLDLQTQGFSIDIDSLVNLLREINIVSSVDDSTIEIKTIDTPYADDKEISDLTGTDVKDVEADRVTQMATKKATDDLKDEL